MTENITDASRIKLWCEDIGNPSSEPLLLIIGARAQGIFWPDSFCDALARDGFWVIRFDHRDSGRSTCLDFDRHPYGLGDMAQDIMCLMDSLKIRKAHLVGISMGGVLAQIITARHSEKVSSLITINSTCDLSDLKPKPPGSVKRQPVDVYIEDQMEKWRATYGPLEFPEKFFRPMAERACNRAVDWLAQYNHLLAFQNTDFNIVRLKKETTVPALTIHGTHDPLLPFKTHGKMVMKNIPWAKLVMIEKMGHILGPPFLERIEREIVDFIRSSSL